MIEWLGGVRPPFFYQTFQDRKGLQERRGHLLRDAAADDFCFEHQGIGNCLSTSVVIEKEINFVLGA